MRIIRNIIFVSAMLVGMFGGIGAWAQDGQRYKMRYSCELRQDGKSYKTDGDVLVQGAAFVLTADGLKVYNDCATMWVIDTKAKEVTVDQGSTADFVADPLAALPLFGFNTYKATVHTVRDADGSLRGYDITLSNGSTVLLRIKKKEPVSDGPLSDFSFDVATLSKGYVVNNLK